ncbi:MAG: DUF2249 domain-containing protein [Polaromonas sp.]
MSPNVCAVTLDVRALPPNERPAMIHSVFRSLLPGQAIEVVCNHEDKPLRELLRSVLPGRFSWADLEQAPGRWRAAITRLASGPEGHDGAGCCGACAG